MGAEVTEGAGTRRGLARGEEGNWPRIQGELSKAFLLAELMRIIWPGNARATALPTDRRLCVVRWRARPATRNRYGGRECDRARPGRTRLCLFGSDLSVACRRARVQRGDGGFFDSFSRGVVTIFEVFERLWGETDLPHCSSQNAALKE